MKHLATIQAEYLKYASREAGILTYAEVEAYANLAAEKEAKPKNPWAICTESTGRDSDKYEKCVKDVKKEM